MPYPIYITHRRQIFEQKSNPNSKTRVTKKVLYNYFRVLTFIITNTGLWREDFWSSFRSVESC